METRIKLDPKIIEFIENHGSLISQGDNEYMCLPFYYKKIEGDVLEVFSLDQLPRDLKSMLKDETYSPCLIPVFKGERGDFYWQEDKVVWIPDTEGKFLLLPDKCLHEDETLANLGDDNNLAAEKRRKELWP